MVFRFPGPRYHPGMPGGAGTASFHGLLIRAMNLPGFGSGFRIIMSAIVWSQPDQTRVAAPDRSKPHRCQRIPELFTIIVQKQGLDRGKIKKVRIFLKEESRRKSFRQEFDRNSSFLFLNIF